MFVLMKREATKEIPYIENIHDIHAHQNLRHSSCETRYFITLGCFCFKSWNAPNWKSRFLRKLRKTTIFNMTNCVIQKWITVFLSLLFEKRKDLKIWINYENWINYHYLPVSLHLFYEKKKCVIFSAYSNENSLPFQMEESIFD